jgi:hypothetical protein
MNLKEFIEKNEVTGFEMVGNLILSVIVDEALHGINVDTSNIEAGTLVEKVIDYQIVENNLLMINNYEYDLTQLDLL